MISKMIKESSDSFYHVEVDESLAREVAENLGLELIKYLSSGSLTSAFKVKNPETGNILVLKLSDRSKEYEAYAKVKAVAAHLPPELAKHLPDVYLATNAGSYPRLSKFVAADSKRRELSVIVTEFLVPMRKEVDDKNFVYADVSRLQDPAVVHNIVKTVMQGTLSSDAAPAVREIAKKFYDAIGFDVLLKEIVAKMITLPTDSISLHTEIYTAITSMLRNHNKKLATLLGPKASSRQAVVFTLGATIAEGIANHLNAPETEQLELSSEQQITPHSSVGDKFKELHDALDKLGILTRDVHRGNVMMRPSTGDLVISDVGLFK